ncbi:MAG: hypothetical protein JWN23_1855 [Rhodocyclales bacterium]|nr:hypothetical protein [Rhodocyclales bacterium]
MATIQQYSDYSLLALASYAEALQAATTNTTQLLKAGFAQAELDAFQAEGWQVVNQSSDALYGNSGFSATLFQNVNTGEYVLANRGTAGGRDLFEDGWGIALKGVAGYQILDMYRYYKQLITPANTGVIYSADEIAKLSAIVAQYQPFGPLPTSAYTSIVSAYLAHDIGLGELSATQALTVTGHSLGGHLAIWLNKLAPAQVAQVITFNGAGEGGLLSSAITAAAGLFGGISSSTNDPKVTNVYGDGGVNIISGVGGNIGKNVPLVIEAQSSVDSTLDGLYNHSIVTLSDAVGMAALLSKLAPSLTTSSSNAIFKAASNGNPTMLESVLDAVRKSLLGASVTTTPTDNREALYNNIKALTDSAAFNTLYGKLKLTLSSAELANKAKTEFSALVALSTLSPIVLEGSDAANQSLLDTTLGGVQGNLYTQWQADQALSDADRAAGKANFSDKYLADRAAMLVLVVERNTFDGGIGVGPASGVGAHYEDKASSIQVETGVAGGGTLKQQILFGGATADTLTGANLGDHLYGGAGNDTLDGGLGNDYLEGDSGDDRLVGGSGRDTLIGGAGNDTYVFASTDSGYDTFEDQLGNNKIEVDGQILSVDVSTKASAANTWDKAGVRYVLESGSFLDKTVGGTLLVETLSGKKTAEVQHFHQGDYGLTFSTQATLAAAGESAPFGTDSPTGDPLKLVEGGALAFSLFLSAALVPAGAKLLLSLTGADGALFSLVDGDTQTSFADGEISLDINDDRLHQSLALLSTGDATADASLTLTAKLVDADGADIAGSTPTNLAVQFNAQAQPDLQFTYGMVQPISDYVSAWDIPYETQSLDPQWNFIGARLTSEATLSGDNDFWQGVHQIYTGPGEGTVYGWTQSVTETVTAGAGNDWLIGGDDFIHGFDADAQAAASKAPLLATGGDDLHGGSGNDILIGGASSDVLNGDEGDDLLWGYRANGPVPVAINLPTSGTYKDSSFDPQSFWENVGRNFTWQTPVLYTDASTGELGLHMQASFGASTYSGKLLRVRDIVYAYDEFVDFTYTPPAPGEDDAGSLHATTYDGHVIDSKLYVSQMGADLSSTSSAYDTPDAHGDVINGGAGNDGLFGSNGNDSLDGGADNDTLMGNDGDDLLRGGSGADLLAGGQGNDTLDGGTQNDTLYGETGADYLDGGDGNDHLIGGSDSDELYGGDGNDTLYGDVLTKPTDQYGDDYLDGGAGDDVLNGDGGSDTLFGGEGNDSLFGDASDTPVSKLGNDYLDGEAGNDLVDGGGGDDTLYGGDGNDSLYGDDSGTPQSALGNDYLDGEAGDDSLVGGGGADTLYGGDGNDTLFGDGDDTPADKMGDDYLDGEAGNDAILGGGGQDTLYGGTGNDSLWGDDGDPAASADNDYLDGEEGNDYLAGGGGDDTLLGGQGKDTLWGDYESPSSGGNDYLDGGDDDDELSGGSGNDTLLGGAGNDFLDGGDGDDVLVGGSGTDYLSGGAGNDSYVIGAGEAAINGSTAETIDDSGGQDTLSLACTVDDLTLRQVGNDLKLNWAGNTQALFIKEGFGGAIDTFNFADGQTLTLAQLMNKYMHDSVNTSVSASGANVAGGTASDYFEITGTQAHIQTGQGDDTIIAAGGDTVLVGAGDGNDFIKEAGHTGRVVFGPGVHAEDLSASMYNADGHTYLSIAYGTGDSLLIEDAGTGGIAEYQFDDGTVLTHAQLIHALGPQSITGSDDADVLWGTDSGDSISGAQGDDAIYGGAGDDVLAGGEGVDTLEGGDGSDTLSGGAGDDLLRGGAGNDGYQLSDAMGHDVIEDVDGGTLMLSGAWTTGRVTSSRVGDDLLLQTGATESALTITGYYTGTASWQVQSLGQAAVSVDDWLAAQAVVHGTTDWLAAYKQMEYEWSLPASYTYDAAGRPVVVEVTPNPSAALGTLTSRTTYDRMYSDESLDEQDHYHLAGFVNGKDVSDGSSAARIYGAEGVDPIVLSDTSTDRGAVQRYQVVSSEYVQVYYPLPPDFWADFAGQPLPPGFGFDPDGHGYIQWEWKEIDHYGWVSYPVIDREVDTLQTRSFTEVHGDDHDNQFYMMRPGIVDGGAGNDLVVTDWWGFGAQGDRTLGIFADGGAGDDVIIGSAAQDTLIGGTGNDFIGNDFTVGGGGGDTFVFNAADGEDTLQGSSSNDTIVLQDGLSAGQLSFSLNYAIGLQNDPDPTYAAYEYIYSVFVRTQWVVLPSLDISWGGQTHIHVLIPDSTGNNLAQVRFDDGTSLSLKSVLDGLLASGGVLGVPSALDLVTPIFDATLGLAGNGEVGFNSVAISGFVGGPGNDTLQAGGVGAVAGGAGNDELHASTSGNALNGDAGDDVLIGGAGDDSLDGGLGNDSMSGGMGDDTYVVDSVGDALSESVGSGIDTILSSISYTLGDDNIENLTLTGPSAIDGEGNSLDNVLTGNDSANVLIAGAGNDTLYGNAGADLLEGGSGDDVLYGGGEDNDTLVGGDGNDSLYAMSGGANSLDGGNGNDLLYGNYNNDVVMGGDGDDSLYGGQGDDLLMGGNGNDVYLWSAWQGNDTIVESGGGSDLLSIGLTSQYFAGQYLPGQVVLNRSGTDLLVNVLPTDEVITIKDWYLDDAHRVESIQVNGVRGSSGEKGISLVWNADQVLSGAPAGIIYYDYFLAGYGDQTFTRTGGVAEELQIFGPLPDDVTLQRSGMDLLVAVGYTQETITLKDWYLDDAHKIGIKLFDEYYSDSVSATWDVGQILALTNTTPTANADSANVTEDVPWIMTADAGVLANDTDADTGDALTVSAVSFGTTAGTVGTALVGTYGALTLTADGSYSYLANQAAAEALGAGQTATEIFNYTVQDSAGATSATTLTFTVTGTNDAPVAVGTVADQSGKADAAFSYVVPDGLFNDDDMVDTLSLSATLLDGAALPKWLSFDAATRTFSGTPTATELGVVGIQLNATDSVGAMASTTFQIQIDSVLDPTIVGSADSEVLMGTTGDDIIDGVGGGDTMLGGVGDDLYYARTADDVITEGVAEGHDTVIAVTDDFVLPDNVEDLTLVSTTSDYRTGTGNALDNVIRGSSTATNSLYGLDGNDLLVGSDYGNYLDGGAGADTMIGGGGDYLTHNTFIVDNADDVVIASATNHNDLVEASVSYVLSDNVDQLSLQGSADIDGTGNDISNWIWGNDGNNHLYGGGGDDVLWGSGGHDTLYGGQGNDVYDLSDIQYAGGSIYYDTFIEAPNEGTDSIVADCPVTSFVLPDNIENISASGGQIFGNALDNYIDTRDGADTLSGGQGNDTLEGRAGADVYLFGRGDGNDVVIDDDGRDRYFYYDPSAQDTISFGPDISYEQLWFARSGDDLSVQLIGTQDSITVRNWYEEDGKYHIENFNSSDGKTLLDSQVDNLVSAMAAFAPPSAGQTTLPASYQTALNPVIAANWH